MAIYDFANKTLTVSVVYFGASQSGTSTNIRQLHRSQPARDKGDLRIIGPEGQAERIFTFTYNPMGLVAGGQDVALRVTSVPANSPELPRDEHLLGVDGIVFVCDARAHRVDENLNALLDLEACLARQHLDLQSLPIVFQVNHTDARNSRPPHKVVEDLNPFGFRVVAAMARNGTGVVEAHQAIVEATLGRAQDRLASKQTPVLLTDLPLSTRNRDDEGLRDHIASLPDAPQADLPSLPAHASLRLTPDELQGRKLRALLKAELHDGRIELELVVQKEDNTSGKLSISVEPGSPQPVDAHQPAPAAAPIYTIHQTEEHHAWEPGPVGYGVAGLLGGTLVGVLLTYILLV